jgi:hypothetical protein
MVLELRLIPKPGINLIRFHGVFAPNSKHRLIIIPAILFELQVKPLSN